VNPFALHHRSSSLGHYVSININLLRFKDAEEIFVPKKQEEEQSGEDGIVKGFMICILSRTLLDQNSHGV
jgi:hypothetical protein